MSWTNQDLVDYRIKRSDQALVIAKRLMEQNKCDFAIDRLYQVCFQALAGLVASNGMRLKSYEDAKRVIMKNHVNIEPALLLDLSEIHDELYYAQVDSNERDFFSADEIECNNLLAKAERFISIIHRLILE